MKFANEMPRDITKNTTWAGEDQSSRKVGHLYQLHLTVSTLPN